MAEQTFRVGPIWYRLKTLPAVDADGDAVVLAIPMNWYTAGQYKGLQRYLNKISTDPYKLVVDGKIDALTAYRVSKLLSDKMSDMDIVTQIVWVAENVRELIAGTKIDTSNAPTWLIASPLVWNWYGDRALKD